MKNLDVYVLILNITLKEILILKKYILLANNSLYRLNLIKPILCFMKLKVILNLFLFRKTLIYHCLSLAFSFERSVFLWKELGVTSIISVIQSSWLYCHFVFASHNLYFTELYATSVMLFSLKLRRFCLSGRYEKN